MIRPLTTEQRIRIDALLSRMSLTECVHQTLCPAIWKVDDSTSEQVTRQAEQFPELGGLFFGSSFSPAQVGRLRKLAQAGSRVPLVVPMDFENGPGAGFADGLEFPVPMAAGAAYANDPETTAANVERMGEATARFGIAGGCRWALGPVVDLCRNPRNPIVMTRSFGDDPEMVAELAKRQIRGIQKSGRMAATAKHFPGDGVDARDQHYVTSVNSQTKADWLASDGAVWCAVIDEGVLAVMSGHIALPCADPEADFRGPRPATLSSRIQNELLRSELGFEGLLVSDALVMGGIQSHLPASRVAPATLAAGTDLLLFADPETDRDRILDGVRAGLVSEARIREAAGRVLAFKARLGLLTSETGEATVPEAVGADGEVYRQSAKDLARRSVTIVRDAHGVLPLNLAAGAPVLVVNLFHEEFLKRPPGRLFSVLETELRDRGLAVTTLANPDHYALFEALPGNGAIFVNLYTRGMPGTRQLVGKPLRSLWRSFWTEHPKVVFTSFDNPFHLLDLLSIPTLVNAYGPEEVSQRAAVRVWLGEADAVGAGLPGSSREQPPAN